MMLRLLMIVLVLANVVLFYGAVASLVYVIGAESADKMRQWRRNRQASRLYA